MTVPEFDPSVLPSEIRAAFEAERARQLALEADVAALAEHNRRLEHLVAEFRQILYGRRSDKLDEDARPLAFEDSADPRTDARTRVSSWTSDRTRPCRS
jgi:transposase